jgi:phage terminase large subunit GpA-like protein
MPTIADLQAERDKLRAVQAKEAFDEALADTVAADAMIAGGKALYRLLTDALDALPRRLLNAIRDAHDETTVHYLLSDAMHGFMEEVSSRGEALIGDEAAKKAFRRAIKPRDLLTVSQWADRHRWLDSGTNAPGQWRTGLTPYLREIMDALSEHSPVRTVTFIKSAGVGGPLDLATPIPTPDGWRTMGDIQVGALVFDETGRPCNVTYVSPVFDGRQCYEIEFSDGAVITCDDEHRWTVDDRFPGHAGKKRGQQRGQVTLKTAELAATFLSRGRWRYAIPVCGALEIPPSRLPISPYVLGYWLANGNLSSNQMTAHEDDAVEIAGHLTGAGWPAQARKLESDKGKAANIILETPKNESGQCLRGHVLSEVGSFVNAAGVVVCRECHRQHAMHYKYGRSVDPVVRAPGFLTRIAALSVDSKNHIPRSYLRASAAQRLELLCGLMDGDGSIGANGRCEYSTVSGGLAGDVMELLRSLGLKPTRGTAPRRGFSGRPASEASAHHRIGFVAYADQPVFKLQRKRARQPMRDDGNPSIVERRFIVDVRPVASRPVRCIAVDSASHLYLCGKEMIPTHNTEAMYNWIGYIMHHLANKDVLVVLPTLELRDREFNPRLGKMLTETRALADLVTAAERNKANRADIMEYGARAKVVKAGANSPNSLRSVHLPYVICDEVDGFAWDVGGEGDPMTLIENRQRTFSRAKTYYVSTPTIEHQSRIKMLYDRSDMRRYHVPCPHCGQLQTLDLGGKDIAHGLKWRTALPTADGETTAVPQVAEAWYVCRHCAKRIDEGHKPAMLAGGKWIAARPCVAAHRGYHLNALYAPIGLGLDWKQVAQKWLSCRGDTAELKGFVNTYLGEVWTEKGDGVELTGLITRLEEYRREDLPIGIVSFGADVQKDRIEYSLVGWGEGEQAWLLDHVILPGDTAQPQVWDDLAAALADEKIDIGVIDSGYNTSMVYAFCEGRRWAIPGKGIEGAGRPVVEDQARRAQRLRKRRKKGAAIEPIGVDQAKAILYARLKQVAPGPGYLHFPRDVAFDDEYFEQLTAEKLVPKTRNFVTIYEWTKTRPRNEALDCLVYAFAAMRLSGKDPGVEFERRTAAQAAKTKKSTPSARPAQTSSGSSHGFY